MNVGSGIDNEAMGLQKRGEGLICRRALDALLGFPGWLGRKV